VAPLSTGGRTVSALVVAPVVLGQGALTGPVPLPADGSDAPSPATGRQTTTAPVVDARPVLPASPASPASFAGPPLAVVPAARPAAHRGPVARPYAPLPLLDLAAAAAPADRSGAVDPGLPGPPPVPAPYGPVPQGAARPPERRSERPGPGRPTLDLDRLAGAVHRRFVRQLAIEAERRGVPPRGGR